MYSPAVESLPQRTGLGRVHGSHGTGTAGQAARRRGGARGLNWSRLKGADAERAALLRAAAERAGCQAVLALAEVKETWDAWPSDSDPWDDYDYYDDEDEDEDDEEDYSYHDASRDRGGDLLRVRPV
jgi:hypothetical protein